MVDRTHLRQGEYVAMGGGALLIIALFLTWYHVDRLGELNGTNGSFTGWDAHHILRWLLLLAGLAPFILAWIIVRGHKLTWRPGEITMIVGMTAFALIILNGVILGRPGDPDSEIDIKIGYIVGLIGAAMICAGGIIRQAEGDRARKPPGTL